MPPPKEAHASKDVPFCTNGLVRRGIREDLHYTKLISAQSAAPFSPPRLAQWR